MRQKFTTTNALLVPRSFHETVHSAPITAPTCRNGQPPWGVEPQTDNGAYPDPSTASARGRPPDRAGRRRADNKIWVGVVVPILVADQTPKPAEPRHQVTISPLASRRPQSPKPGSAPGRRLGGPFRVPTHGSQHCDHAPTVCVTRRHFHAAAPDFHDQPVELRPRKAQGPRAASWRSSSKDRVPKTSHRAGTPLFRRLPTRRCRRQAEFGPAWPCCTSVRRWPGRGPSRIDCPQHCRKSNAPHGNATTSRQKVSPAAVSEPDRRWAAVRGPRLWPKINGVRYAPSGYQIMISTARGSLTGEAPGCEPFLWACMFWPLIGARFDKAAIPRSSRSGGRGISGDRQLGDAGARACRGRPGRW